jgi:EAL and modified HD-GYP domain-containing signal transduction protein
MRGWLGRLIGKSTAAANPVAATVILPARTAPAASAPGGAGVRRALVGSSGEVAGFEFCFAASIEQRLRRRADPVAQAAHALALLSLMRPTVASGCIGLIRLPSQLLARPNVLEQLQPGAFVCIDDSDAIAGETAPTADADAEVLWQTLRARGMRVGLTVTDAASSAKPDFRIVAQGGDLPDRLLARVREVHQRQPELPLIASDLDSVDAIEQCLAAGATWASGRFVGQVSARPARPMQADMQRIIGLLNSLGDERKPLADLTRDLRTDAPLCYRLLRQVNSPGMGLKRSVDSIDQAVLVLGRSELQRWLSVLMLASVNGRRTSRAVQEVALARARLLELLAPGAPGPTPDALFTVGLLSLLDVMLQMPLEQALGPLRLSAYASAALLQRSGPWHRWLALAEALERQDLDAADALANDISGVDRVLEMSDQAWQWASSVQRALHR